MVSSPPMNPDSAELELARMSFRDWMPRSRTEQWSWVARYLNDSKEVRDFYVGPTQGMYGAIVSPTYEKVIDALARMQVHSIKGYKLTNKIKAAWGQQKYRASLEANDKKIYNYVMSIQAGEQLQKIAKTCQLSLNKTLELLIQLQHDHLVETGATHTPRRPTPADLVLTPIQAQPAPDRFDWDSPMNAAIKQASQGYAHNAAIRRSIEAEQEAEQRHKAEMQQATKHLRFEKGSAKESMESRKKRLQERLLK